MKNNATIIIIFYYQVNNNENQNEHLNVYNDSMRILDSKITVKNDKIVIGFGSLQQNNAQEKLIGKILEDIIKTNEWRQSTCHPVLTLFVDLKTLKFRKVYFWNLLMFLSVFMAPFAALYVIRLEYYIPGFTQSVLLESTYVALKCLCIISVLYLATVELAKFKYFYPTTKDYWRQRTNLIEVAVIIVGTFTVLFFWLGTASTYKPLMISLGALSLLSLMCKMYSSSRPLHLMVIRRIATAFTGYMIFGIIIVFLVKFVYQKIYFSTWFNRFDNLTNYHGHSPFDDITHNDSSTEEDDSDYEAFDPNETEEESFLELMKSEAGIVFQAIFYCVFAFSIVVKNLIAFTGPTQQDNNARQNALNYFEVTKIFETASGNFG